MFDDQCTKYASDEQLYLEMMAWMEMELEMSEAEINEMEREQISRSLTEQNRIISKEALNNKDYDNSDIGA